MMDPEWSLAHVEQASAYHFADHVSIHITGQMPDPCYSVDIERSLLTVEPPELIAKWHPGEDGCPEVMTPYECQKIFRIGEKRETVKLHHANGVLEISVQDHIQPLEEGSPATLAELTADFTPSEATGYSNAFDFAEAFRDAISQLPDRGAGIPDWLSTYEVMSIGAEIGGIAGFNRLYVKVRG